MYECHHRYFMKVNKEEIMKPPLLKSNLEYGTFTYYVPIDRRVIFVHL